MATPLLEDTAEHGKYCTDPITKLHFYIQNFLTFKC